MSAPLAGTATLLKTTIEHDGRRFAPWILILTALSTSSVLVYPWVFPTTEDRAGLAAGIGANPAIGLIFGPAFDLSTTDGFNAWRSLALGGFLAALGAIFAVTRATRAQEDSGQAELLASGVLGRTSRLLTGVCLGLIGSVLAGGIAGLATVLCGGGWENSLLLGATFTATGWMFTAVAAVAAQLGADTRTANSLAVGTLGALFLLRGFTYAVDAPDWMIWANPLGWMTETRPASGNHWWPLWYALAFTMAALAVAFVLQSHRDFGQGAFAPRPGPKRGKTTGPWGLALRINRAPLITWAITFVALGFVFGFFATSVKDILGADSAVAHILASGATMPDQLVSAFLLTIFSLLGIIASVPGVQIMLRVRTEEEEGRGEPLMATALRRARYYGSNVLLALLASSVYLMIAGTLVATLASTADIGVKFGDAFLQALATVPAIWAVVAVAVLVVGARPAVSIAAWAGVLISFALTLLGPTFKLWDWVLAISPFWHVPNVTLADANGWGLLGVAGVAVLLIAIGFAGYRRRDLAV